jgi:cytochrome P450
LIEFGLGDRQPCFAPLLGDGIFTQEGRPWKHSREILRPLFSANRVSNFVQIREHVERLISCIPEDTVVDFQPLFFRFTLDTTTYLLFGQSINSLESENPQTTAFAESFRIAQDYLAQRGRLGGLYWLIGGKEFRQACLTVHQFVDSAIQAALSTDQAPKSQSKPVYAFLDILIQETRDPKILRDQLLNLLLAGRDTTACCLTWAL